MQINASALFDEVGLYEELTFEKPHRLITVLEIQVSESQTYPLEVREYDNPYDLAVGFCVKHQLNEIAVEVVEKRILKILGKDKGRRDGSSVSKGKIVKKGGRMDKGETTIKKNNNARSSLNIASIKPSPLYQKGMRAMYKAEETRIKVKMEKQAEEQRELTFKPKINEVSEKIVEVRKIIGGNVKKTNKLKIHELKDEMKQCTFKPNINKQSHKIVEQRFIRNEEENIERLYNDSDFKRKRQQKMTKEKERYSYHPTINEKSKVQIRDTFMERLEKDERNKKQKQLKNINQNQCCSFTPEIGRPPKIERNKQNLPIGQYLMNSQTQSKLHLRSKSQIKEDITTVGFGEVALFGKNSGVIYNNLIKQRIESLFELLDGNGDGLISPQYIDIQLLSTNTLLLLQPFFKQMQDMNAVLDERGFTKAIMKLLEVAPQHLKGEFISERWKKPEDPKFSFKPTLNNKSHRLAQNRSTLDLYEEGLKSKKKKEVYTAILQAKKEEEELDRCTFKPLLNSVSHVYFKKYLMKDESGNQLSYRYLGSSRNEEV